jgi:ABC-type maltose transport system permease subunit
LLSDLCKKVYVIQNLDYLTGEKKLQERLAEKSNVQIITGATLHALHGESELDKIAINMVATGEKKILEIDGLFVAIGLIPQNEAFANVLNLDNPIGIIIIYLGFGAGLSVFMFSGFIKSVPVTIEEAATIDGCNSLQVFWRVVFPILKPTAITVAILNAMWIWNDYLLPYLVIGNDYKTIPIAVQYLKGGYGSVDMGAMMAMLVLSIIPVIIFYLSCQKYIIKGVAAGAVKG